MLSFPTEFQDIIPEVDVIANIAQYKLFVYEKYKTACEDTIHQPVNLWVFRKLRNSFFPYVFATKPRTDLCMTCQQNISLVM